MNTPDKCPGCGAVNEDPRWKGYFPCGSWVDGKGAFRETTLGTCLNRQRDQLLQKVQRLESAGDYIASIAMQLGATSDQLDQWDFTKDQQ